MKINKLLFLIFLIALFVRLYKLGSIPVGFHADEARAGWNAYSILKTGKDDHNNLLPLYYNTFGDFRPAGIIYITIPSLLIFKNSIFAVRFPAAVIGALTIFPIYFLAKIFFDKYKNKQYLSYLAAFFIAVSAWHISVSRATSEVVIAIFFSLWGLYFLTKKRFIYAFIFILMSYFFYHSVRLLTPFFAIAIIFYFYHKISKKIFIFLLALFLMTAIFVFSKQGMGRFNQVSIFNITNSTGNGNFINSFITEYTSYISPAFLVTENARPFRYSITGTPLVNYLVVLFFAAGIFFIIRKNNFYLPLFLLLLAPLAAALTSEDSPNIHRSLYMLPFIILIAAYGASVLLNKRIFVTLLVIAVLLFSLVPFWRKYAGDNKYSISQYRNYSAANLAVYLDEVKNNFDKVYITNQPDSIYPWYAFFTHQDPQVFNKEAAKRDQEIEWSFGNLIFTRQQCPSGDMFRYERKDNILVVEGEGCALERKIRDGMKAKILKTFQRPDNKTEYSLITKN